MTEVKEEIIELTTIFQKGKIQIPIEVRKRLHLKDGDKVVWIQTVDGKIYIKKAKPVSLFRLTDSGRVEALKKGKRRG